MHCMSKKYFIIFPGLIIALIVAWYLISPVFRSSELDDAVPEFMEEVAHAPEEKVNALTIQVPAPPGAVETVVVEEVGDRVQDEEDAENPVARIFAGPFVESAHHVEGSARILEGDDERVLRFEDFDTSDGPNLHIYLSSDLNATDFVDLGKIRATTGNINYDVDPSIDLEKYDKVLVWCVPFGVLFSYAEL